MTESEKKKLNEELAKIGEIEGLFEIKDAIAEREKFLKEYNDAVENGTGILPAPPKTDIKALMDKYPRASAYLKAENYMKPANFMKSDAGIRARDRIVNGEDYEKVISDMESEWKSFCEKHMWD